MEIDEQKYNERLAVLEKIKEYEKDGNWYLDAENDPPAEVLMPNKVDYLHKKISTKLKRKFSFWGAKKYMQHLLKADQLKIKNVIGLENLQNINTGMIITSNHFNQLDTFIVQYVTLKAGIKKENLYRVIREGNYTNCPVPGFVKLIMRYCNTLPLSSNTDTMKKFYKAMDTVLKKGKPVVVYPEQAMWWNYKKPRPLQDGAFKFAVRSNVPIVPMFVTMDDSDVLEDNGFKTQEYTIHIFPPIYPDSEKSKTENIKLMREKNFELWKNCYENFYGVKYDLPI